MKYCQFVLRSPVRIQEVYSASRIAHDHELTMSAHPAGAQRHAHAGCFRARRLSARAGNDPSLPAPVHTRELVEQPGH